MLNKKMILLMSLLVLSLLINRGYAWPNGYTYQSNYSVSNFLASVSGAELIVNPSQPTGYICGAELIQDSSGNNVSFYRNGCNNTPTSNVYYFLKMPSSATSNVSFYTGNISYIADNSKCDMTTSIACDNAENTLTGWTGTIAQQQVHVKEGSYGFQISGGDYPYKETNLSITAISPTRLLMNLYGYSSVSVSHYFHVISSGGSNFLLWRVSTNGLLQYCGWVNYAGLVFEQNAWNTMIVEWDSSKFNTTLINSTGSYSENGNAIDTSACASNPANQQDFSYGSDNAGITAYTDTYALFNYSKTTFTYQGTINNSITVLPTSTSLFLNDSQANLTGTYGITINATAQSNITGLYVALYRNGTLLANTTTRAEDNTLLGVGLYNMTGVTQGNTSFTSSNITWWANISKAFQSLTLTFNTSNSVYQGIPVLITCSGIGTMDLFNDTGSLSNPYTQTTSGLLGTYNYTCNTTGNTNYSSATINKTLTINLLPPSNVTGNVSIVYDIAALMPNSVYCSDNSTLRMIYLEPNITRNINCPSGCDSTNNVCNPSLFMENLILIGGIMLFAIVLIVLAWRLSI